MTVEIRSEARGGLRALTGLATDARELMRLAAAGRHELSVLLVEDRAIRALNRRFRGKDRPTDVLAFSQLETGKQRRLPAGYRPGNRLRGKGIMLGDIVISFDTARRQARQMGLTWRARLRTLLIHGFLHLLGYDHEGSHTQAKVMFAREHELEAALPRIRTRWSRRALPPVRKPR